MSKLQGLKGGSKKIWKCKAGCRVTKDPCPHLERLLCEPNSASPKFESVYKRTNRSVDKSVLQQEERTESLRQKLEEKDLDPITINILVLRYTYDETFSVIDKELKIGNVETVKRLHDEALKRLRGMKW